MIHFVTGKPRAGKGLVVMKEIIDTLVGSDMVVITDLPIRLDAWLRPMGRNKFKPEKGLLAHLRETNEGKDFNARERIKIITEEQAIEFYLQRQNLAGEWIQLPCERDDKGRVVSFTTSIPVKPTLYVTDECWRTFGARNWQHTAAGVLYYAAQHAKMSDRWLLVSQHTKQIDTALRQVAQDFWLIKNHANLSMGIFQRPALFTVSIYETAPNNGVGQEPMSTKVFRIDKAGVGSCYDTAAGTGIVGQSGADINQKRRGVPFLGLVIAGLAILGFLVMSPSLLKAGAKKAFGMGESNHAAPVALPPTNQTAAINSGTTALAQKIESTAEEKKPEPEPEFVMLSLLRSKIEVVLSDGTEFTATSYRDLGNRVRIDGKEYKKKRPEYVELTPEKVEFELPTYEKPLPKVSTHTFGNRGGTGLPARHQPLNPQPERAFDAR